MQYCYGCMKPIDTDDHMCGTCGFDVHDYVVAPHHLPPGTVLHERYLLGKVLGEGGFGITYVGRDTLLDMKVAVKEFYMNGYVNRNNTVSHEVLASVGTGSDLFTQNKAKFIEEARVLARFSNEVGIVGIRDFFEENGTAYMIMDFIEGTTLRTYLERKGKMPMRDVIMIMEPVMHALQHVHEQNVIHRDISPDNIMITPEKQIKLLDFGAAREISKNDAKSLSVILKPGYAPEEQYRSRGQQGTWTDVYALSATMYRCISGITPDDAMERMFEDKVKPLHQICACTPAVSSVIMKGLSVRKDGRYQSIRELRKDLERALEDPNFIVKVGTGRETAPQRPQQQQQRVTAPQQKIAQKVPKQRPAQQSRTTNPQTGAPVSKPSAPVQRPVVQPQVHHTAQTNPPAAGKKRRKWLIPVIIAGALTVIGIIGAIAGIASNVAKNKKKQADELPEAVAQTEAVTQTEEVTQQEAAADYRFCIGDREYQLPETFWSFEVLNWVFRNEDDSERLLVPGETVSGVVIENSQYGAMEVTFHNPTQYTLLMRNTQIEAIRLDMAYFDSAQAASLFKVGLSSDGSYLFSPGSRAKEQLNSVFGEPVDGTYQSIIDVEHYCRIFTEDEDRITVIELYNRVEEAFDSTVFMDMAPGLIYTSAKGPGTEGDGLPYVLCLVKNDGTLVDYYGVGVRLQEYMDEESEIREAPDYLRGRDFTWVDVVKPGSQTMRVLVCNPFDDMLQIGQCLIAGVYNISDTSLGDAAWMIYDIANDDYIGYAQEEQYDGKTLSDIGYYVYFQSDNGLQLLHEETDADIWIASSPGDSEKLIKYVSIDALDYVFSNPSAIVESE